MQEWLNQIFGVEGLTTPLKILLLFTLLSLLPAIIMTMTSFVRIVVVLSFIRQGIGSPQTPPNQVIVGLAIFLTLFVMGPVVEQVKEVAVDPYIAGQLSDV